MLQCIPSSKELQITKRLYSILSTSFHKTMQTTNATIAAISTASGTGGIAVVRISGEKAFAIADTVFRPARKGKAIASAKAYTMIYGTLFDPATGNDIDEVIAAIFHAPHSFTGENAVEISCHGSMYVQQEILRVLIAAGCRMAAAGEFTQRAFANGRIDLSQAEAVADLISARSAAAHRVAFNQMRGGISSRLEELRRKLLHITSLLELELDFSDHEELEFADRTELQHLAAEIEQQISAIMQSFATGSAIKEGIPVAIVGETNAGKSTLLNLLVGDERAIVSDIHGTTRDVIEDTAIIRGHLFRFIDTAGLRQTTDIVENLGIERTYSMIERAQIIIWMVDSTAVTEHVEWLAERILRRADGKPIIIALNKSDRLSSEESGILRSLFSNYNATIIEISAKQRHNTDTLIDQLCQTANIDDNAGNDIIITNARHYEALDNAHNSVKAVTAGLASDIPSDLIAQDLRECLHHLAEITGGEITTPEILSNIFSHFCIGK